VGALVVGWERRLEQANVLGHEHLICTDFGVDAQSSLNDWHEWADRFNRAGENAAVWKSILVLPPKRSSAIRQPVQTFPTKALLIFVSSFLPFPKSLANISSFSLTRKAQLCLQRREATNSFARSRFDNRQNH